MDNFWADLPKPFFCLAPMADVTDAAFRRVIAKRGLPDVMWTEFVSADGLFKGGYDKLIDDLKYSEEERPIVAQFFSKDPELMARAAKLAEELGFDGVDINMGCPDKSVCKQGAGAAMIRTPDLAREVIRETKKATKLPVSVKTRIGFNENEIETWMPALLSEEPSAVSIHARTKKEMSKVPAHWDVISRAVEIRDELGSKALIIGNGDVTDLDDARTKAKESGVDGVMLGRAIFGNPWLFADLARARRENQIEHPDPEASGSRPNLPGRLKVLVEHIKLFDELLPNKNFMNMKKHFKSYLKGEGFDKKLLLDLMETKTAGQALEIVEQHLST